MLDLQVRAPSPPPDVQRPLLTLPQLADPELCKQNISVSSGLDSEFTCSPFLSFPVVGGAHAASGYCLP